MSGFAMLLLNAEILAGKNERYTSTSDFTFSSK